MDAELVEELTATETLLPKLRVVGFIGIVGFGVSLGLLLPSLDSPASSPPPLPPWSPNMVPPSPPSTPPPSPSCGSAVDSLSAIIGWTYFAAWSLSFWPQIVMNFERRSVVGLSFDFVLLNFVGFGCYSAYNIGLYYVPSIQQQYADANDGNKSSVRINDVFFALHALAACAIGLLQIGCYERGRQRFSTACLAAVAAVAAAAIAGVVVVLARPAAWSTWFHFLYALSFVKLAISIVKYVPQVLLNMRRRSTDGWNIDNVVLDFTGGALSLTQQLIDSGCSADWSAISGDPVKFGLGFASMFFDCIFLAQHYVCFRPRRSSILAAAAPPLLIGEGDVPKPLSPRNPSARRGAARGTSRPQEAVE